MAIRDRLTIRFEAALRIAEGYVVIDTMDDSSCSFQNTITFQCGFTVPELQNLVSSPSTPFGSCSGVMV